jgi:pimeloyl-ACP methyl ester carboxylesterase
MRNTLRFGARVCRKGAEVFMTCDAKWALAAACLCLAACNQQQLAERIVAAPNGWRTGSGEVGQVGVLVGNGSAFRFRCDKPEGTLAVWVHAPAQKPRGTILMLHGIWNDHHQVDGMSGTLVAAGYRTVQVDLRGHGESTGEHLSFGVFDARDLSLLITALQKQGLCEETLGVYGVSYGAATGLQLCGVDPRVKAMVAVASFATLREEAPSFARHALPMPGAMLSDGEIASILNKAGVIAGFNPDDASPLAGIEKTRAKVLLIHGDADEITPCEASEKLHAAAADHSELVMVHGKGHLDLSFDMFGELNGRTLAWFERNMGK